MSVRDHTHSKKATGFLFQVNWIETARLMPNILENSLARILFWNSKEILHGSPMHILENSYHLTLM
jgi:hypothetical protein